MPIEVDQIIRSKRKTISIIVKPGGSVIVRAPLRASEKSIQEFIEKNRQWIEKKKAEALAFIPLAPRQYTPGEAFLFLGNSYPLEIVHGQKKPLLLEENFKLAASAQEKARSVYEHWYRIRAKEILTERVNYYADLHKLHYKKIGITSARTRWGSCSASGSLNFSWRLIMAPMEVVDYVVVHELVHTLFHNHSKRFWNRVKSFMPEYQEHRKWLRHHGPGLML